MIYCCSPRGRSKNNGSVRFPAENGSLLRDETGEVHCEKSQRVRLRLWKERDRNLDGRTQTGVGHASLKQGNSRMLPCYNYSEPNFASPIKPRESLPRIAQPPLYHRRPSVDRHLE